MENSVNDLSELRLAKAREDLDTALDNLKSGKYRASVNRSYYAVFHALRAVTAQMISSAASPPRMIYPACGGT